MKKIFFCFIIEVLRRTGVLAGIFLLFVSCTQRGGGGGMSLLPEEDNFLYKDPNKKEDVSFEVTQKEKLDVLWVVDNSASMALHQKKVRDNFKSFIEAFQSYAYDFHIGIITTDAYLLSASANPFISHLKDAFIITSNTPNMKARFMENIDRLIGNMGSYDERGMESLIRALESKYSKSFLRQDAFLSIIIVSDEEDFSTGPEPNPAEADGASYFRFNERSPDAYVSYFQQKLVNLKGGNREDFSISSIIVDDIQCENKLGASSGVSRLYPKIAEATSGRVSSLCNRDFSQTMQKSAQSIISRSRYLQLTREPNMNVSIQVFVNGKEKIKGTHWVYHSERQAVYFLPHALPQVGDSIDVQYLPLRIQIDRAGRAQ